MNANTFGKLFQFTSFGESHGPAYGVVLTGVPAGLSFNEALLEKNMQRRRPGQHPSLTSRKEEDLPEILSGLFEGKTLGTPIGVLVRNTNARPSDYSEIEKSLESGKPARPGHADDLWRQKFGHSDVRGGGRASGRETLCRVIAGSFAQMFLSHSVPELKVHAFATKLGALALDAGEIETALKKSSEEVDAFSLRFPSKGKNSAAETLLAKSKEEGESWGGEVLLSLSGLPVGLGQPLYAKIKNEFASAMMSIGATMGFELGLGEFDPTQPGSQFHSDSKNYSGLRGGLSTGERIVAKISIKAPSTIGALARKGRHDPCIVPRVIPVVEAMAHCVLADQVLMARLDRV
jgi:chorismate synthase